MDIVLVIKEKRKIINILCLCTWKFYQKFQKPVIQIPPEEIWTQWHNMDNRFLMDFQEYLQYVIGWINREK